MDALLRAVNEPQTLRVISAITTEAVREACRRQGAQGVGATVLGRALTSGVLLATLGKGERERVRLQFVGGGPVGQIVIDAYGDGRVRACTSNTLEPSTILNRMLEVQPRPSTAAAVGVRGHVVITRDLGLATPYQGSVDLHSGEIDEDIEFYLAHSEQLPSVLRAAVMLDAEGQVLRAGGILVQGLPGSPADALDPIRARVEGLRSVLGPHDRGLDELVGLALGGEGFQTMLEHPVTFHCPCGPQRALDVLSTLGPADLDALASEQEQTEVRCNFCGDVTTVEAPQIRELAQRLRSSQS